MSAPIADSLAAASAVRTAAEALQGRDAWIVGGAVRDAALGRDVVDVDLAVAQDPEVAARAIAKAAGGPAFSSPRSSAPGGPWGRTGTWT